MNKRLLFASALFAAALLCACGEKEQSWKKDVPKTTVDKIVAGRVGDVLPGWEEGWLDIHSINTGRGECFFYIFADGTTMLIDAGGARNCETYTYANGASPGVPSKPSQFVSSASVISNYIRHYMPSVSNGKLDYMMVSHYHGDHFGTGGDEFPIHSEGGFRMNSVTSVGCDFPAVKILDRGDFNDPPSSDWFDGTTNYDNYIKFVNWSVKKYGTVHEKIRVGATDQIVPKHDPSACQYFQVRNLAAGGYVWTGTGTESSTALPSTAELMAYGKGSGNQVGENVMSVALLFSQGSFDWFTGGDGQHNGYSTYPYKDIETPIAKAVNKRVDAMKADHHCTNNTNSEGMVSIYKPEVVIAGVWRDVQPNPATVQRFINYNPNVHIFATNLTTANREVLEQYGINMGRFESTGGHVVIRVHPTGLRYWIFVLDDTDQEYRISKRVGPFTSN